MGIRRLPGFTLPRSMAAGRPTLGLERRAVDAVVRACPTVVLPRYSRPLVRAADYVELLEQHTFNGQRVR